MESALTRLAAFPATGIIIKAATSSTAIQHFIRLETDLMRDPETIITAEPFRQALSEIWVEFDPNGGNAGGFILLIAAARRLEPLSTAESERMVAALQRIIDLTIRARSIPSIASTAVVPPSQITSAPPVSLSTSIQSTQISTSLSSSSGLPASTLTPTVAPSTNKRSHSSAIAPTEALKRPRTGSPPPQSRPSWKDLSTEAILSTPDQRMTIAEISEYAIGKHEYFRAKGAKKVKKGISDAVNNPANGFEKVEIATEATTSTGAIYYYRIQEVVDPEAIKWSNATKSLIIEAILSTPTKRMTIPEIVDHLRKNYEYFGTQKSGTIKRSIYNKFFRKGRGFEKGEVAGESEEGVASHYWGIEVEAGIENQIEENGELDALGAPGQGLDRLDEVMDED